MVLPQNVNPILARLLRLIDQWGALTVADYMSAVLTAERDGYYMKADPLGAAGDFITAPEISQMFGELIGLWCVDCWQKMGAPNPVVLAEAGPGRGTLMADALRAAGQVPAFRAAAQVHLIEVSPALKAKQAATLAPYLPAGQVSWHDTIGDLPEGPLLLIMNEFLDALPVRQFQRSDGGWRERVIVANPDGDGLSFALGPSDPLISHLIPPEARDAPVDSIIEVSPAVEAQMMEVCERLARQAGAALIIDYGHTAPRFHSSLQAVRRHRYHPFLDRPGEADLTAHVNFFQLTKLAAQAGIGVQGPTTQGRFLQQLGIDVRAQHLCAKATGPQAKEIMSAKDRLTDPGQMGEPFKVLAITSAGLAGVAGFD